MRDVSGGTKIAAFEGMVAPGRVPVGVGLQGEVLAGVGASEGEGEWQRVAPECVHR
jgi:hypothetical protein